MNDCKSTGTVGASPLVQDALVLCSCWHLNQYVVSEVPRGQHSSVLMQPGEKFSYMQTKLVMGTQKVQKISMSVWADTDPAKL